MSFKVYSLQRSVSPNSVSFRLEMAITHAEFLRILPLAIEGRRYHVQDGEILIFEVDRKISIKLLEASVRAIAALRLSMIKIEVSFHGYSKADVEDFMRRFKLHFQRGGG
jgi:hypothetical protein